MSSAVKASNVTLRTSTSSRLMPIASRVASTLRSMYGSSRSCWLGLTTSDCTIAGYTSPPATRTTSHRADAISGSRHDPVRSVDRYSTAVSRAMSMSSISAGSWALTTAYVAPCTKPRRSLVVS